MKFIWTDHLLLCILQSATITLLAHEQQVSSIKHDYYDDDDDIDITDAG